MYEGTIKSAVIAGREKPELSAPMTGNAYKKGDVITFDEIVKNNDHLWAKKGSEYILLASDSGVFISYKKMDTSSAFSIESDNSESIDTNEITTGFIPVDLQSFTISLEEKIGERLLELEGESNNVKAQYLIWYSSQREISQIDISGYTDEEIELAYHEIYARHGKTFNTEWLQSYFESRSWYTKADDNTIKLSTLESLNTSFLKNVLEGNITKEVPVVMSMRRAVMRTAVVQDTSSIATPSEIEKVISSSDSDKNEYFIWNSSKELLTIDDLDWISRDENDQGLLIAWNEIYARHGKKFTTEFLKNWFNGRSWYKPSDTYNTEDEDANLSVIELANVAFIKAFAADRDGIIESGKGAIDYLNTYGIVETAFGRFSGSTYFDPERGQFVTTNAINYTSDQNGGGTFTYNNEALFQDGENTRQITINGVVYQFEIDDSRQFQYGDMTTYGLGITNTISGEYLILAPSGAIFEKDANGNINESEWQHNADTYSWTDPHTGTIQIRQFDPSEGKSRLQMAKDRIAEIEERKNREIEAAAHERFLLDGWANEYVETFETTYRNSQAIKRSMRLFGLPYQFTPQADPRYASVSTTIGRKFAENILKEAPIVTIIPGLPRYLGNSSKDEKKSTTIALMEGSHESFGPLKSLIGKNPSKYLRYYDFQARYIDYMKYVNILCRTAATFLEITEELDGTTMQQYDWRNYRCESDSYSSLVGDVSAGLGTILKNAGYDIESSVKRVVSVFSDGSITTEITTPKPKTDEDDTAAKENPEGEAATTNNSNTEDTETTDKTKDNTTATTEGETAEKSSEPTLINSIENTMSIVEAARGMFKSTGTSLSTLDKEGNVVEKHYDKHQMVYETTTDDSEDFESVIEDVLTSQNFVQFMIDPDSGVSEDLSNSTGESQFKGMFDTASQTLKEIMFITQSGGMDASGLQDLVDSGMDAASSWMDTTFSNGGASIVSRLLSVGSNVLKGENIIMPQIYQSSQYTKSYSFTIHLKAENGSKLSYFMDIVVPLMHLLALALPRQTTSNTYGSPFLVKCFIEGVFTCNLGMVTSLQVNKNISPESWTIEGLPNEVDVTIGITDLYSDLTMSPQSDPLLFMNNSSLIEYLATTCGLSLIKPQIKLKIESFLNTYANSVKDALNPKNFGATVSESIENFAQKYTGLIP